MRMDGSWMCRHGWRGLRFLGALNGARWQRRPPQEGVISMPGPGTPRGQGGQGAGIAVCNRYTGVVAFLGKAHLAYKEREKGTPPTL